MIDPSEVPLEARHAITRKFRDFPIFKRSRAAAVYHFFAALESFIPIDVANPEAILALHRRAVEAAQRAIPALSEISNRESSDVLQLSGLLAGDVKESRNGNPTRDLQMAADRSRLHTLCGPVVPSLFSFAARC